MSTTGTITATTAKLRAIADLVDAHPDLPQPYITAHSSGNVAAHWYFHINALDGDLPGQKSAAAQVVSTLGGQWDKVERSFDDSLEFNQDRNGVALQVVVNRAAVCERVVIGTHEVTVAAMPKIPARAATLEHVKTVEDVQWVCSSLLAGEPVLS